LNDQEYRNNLALASYAYDRDLDLASDVAMGGLFGSIAGGIIGAVFKKKKTPNPEKNYIKR
jgi:Na+/glutamate symporter